MCPVARASETDWLGQPALALETIALRFVTVPAMGAKIVSLFDKRANREWLLPPIHRRFEPAAYRSVFTDQDMSGWDEMFPTIDECVYPVDGAYQGKLLPDHGEVWAIPWEINNVTNDSFSLSTSGRALPYRLTRTTQILEDARLRLTFDVVNTGSEPLVALWAAHPQFVVDGDTRIRLPHTVTQVVNVHPTTDWGAVGNIYDWPNARAQDGRHHNLDHIGAADRHNCRKFYLLPDQPVNWAALQQGGDGAWLRLSWNAAEVPYLGIWVDEGTYNAAPTTALEPSTGYYDKLDFAWQNGRAMVLPSGEPVSWQLDLEVGNGPLA